MENIITLFLLIMLQVVLGVDNLLYISLVSKNAPEEKQNYVRNVGISFAIVLRVLFLFLIIKLISFFQDPLFGVEFSWLEGHFNLHSIVVFLGGGFIVYTAVKEIWHMISIEEHAETPEVKTQSVAGLIIAISIMNVVFSFDSILSAIALTKVMWVMVAAIIIGGVLMIWLSEKVSNFLKKNRMYEVLGLFILFLVGVMLLTESGHLSHLTFWGNEITPMNKTTFYFIILILIIVDVVQGKYQKKLTQAKLKNADED